MFTRRLCRKARRSVYSPSASLSVTKADKRTEEEDEKNEMTKKMFVYENGTIRETGETFRDDLLDVGANSRYENLSEITLSLSKNLFAGNTGAHEWTAGFKPRRLSHQRTRFSV